MTLSVITCSGPNEKNQVSEILDFLKAFPAVEIGVQVSDHKASYGLPRYDWIQALSVEARRRKQSVRAALHINMGWCKQLCDGIVASELADFIGLTDGMEHPLFSRLQLNFSTGKDQYIVDSAKPETVADVMASYPDRRFILSHNARTDSFVRKIDTLGMSFDTLYDASFGEGILPDNRPAPAFSTHLQGYAGGLSPENVSNELDKIIRVVPSGRLFFIDAEGKLENEHGAFCIKRATAFVSNALNWQREHA